MALSHSDSRIGMFSRVHLSPHCREPPRPAIAPFSEADQNVTVDERRYPPERTPEEDEVMMDFVSGQ